MWKGQGGSQEQQQQRGRQGGSQHVVQMGRDVGDGERGVAGDQHLGRSAVVLYKGLRAPSTSGVQGLGQVCCQVLHSRQAKGRHKRWQGRGKCDCKAKPWTCAARGHHSCGAHLLNRGLLCLNIRSHLLAARGSKVHRICQAELRADDACGSMRGQAGSRLAARSREPSRVAVQGTSTSAAESTGSTACLLRRPAWEHSHRQDPLAKRPYLCSPGAGW